LNNRASFHHTFQHKHQYSSKTTHIYILSAPSPTNWPMIFRSTLSLILAVLVLSVSAQDLTLEDIWKSGKYQQKSVYGLRSMNDGKHYTTIDREDNGAIINKYSYETGKLVETLYSLSNLKIALNNQSASFDSYKFSDDEKMLLLSYDVENIYRHSTKEHYYLINLETKKVKQLSEGAKQRHATISPDSKNVAYVQGNDLIIQEIASGKITPVTTDGEYNKIINGYADWVYEEEFSFDQAFEWAPDGSKLAYYRFDESAVKEFHMPVFNGLYPEDYKFKYPKAGEDNSKVDIKVYDLAKNKTMTPDLGAYEYIPRIKWTESSDMLAIVKMPRLQNQLEVMLYQTNDGSTKSIYKESSDTYIEINDDLTFIEDNAGFVMRSEKDGFSHLYKYSMNGETETQLTKGSWEVSSVLGVDSRNAMIYFTAHKTAPYNQEVYVVSMNGGEPTLLSPADGVSSASFSKSFDYLILNHSTANKPVNISLNGSSGYEVRVLEDNEELNKKLGGLNLSDKEFFDFVTSEGVTLNGWMIKPANFDASKAYPVLMYVYGGPGSQTVTNAMGGNYLWHQFMAQKGYIVVSVDNRGTGARGKAFRTQTYRQLGKYETMDQIEAARWLGELSYVDAARIGIWGWSYGGYMSSLCLSKGADVFKTAIAVAPVSNWRFYDNIYTERYMGLPQDNADGYDDNSPINHVAKMEGNFLLIHGTSDDNVHFQNSVEMVDALIEADKQFDFYIYPDRNHGIYGGNTRHHLFTKITNFIIDNL